VAFPQIAATATTSSAVSTSHNINLPSGIQAGDLLLVGLTNKDSAGAPTFPAGWTQVWSLANDPGAANRCLHVGYYRIADGSEGATITVTFGGSVAVGAWAYRITGAHPAIPEGATARNGTANDNPNPPPLNPAGWDIDDTLWIASFGEPGNRTVSAFPANYTLSQIDGDGIAVAARALAAASDDPGAFTISSNTFWVAATAAVRGTKPRAFGLIIM